MHYMGGKAFQSKTIVQYITNIVGDSLTNYYEPFCGACSVAVRLAKSANVKTMVLNDINKALVLLWDKCVKEGVDWLPTDPQFIAETYAQHKNNQDENDPITAWYGVCCSWYGRWFGALNKNFHKGRNPYASQQREIERKCKALRSVPNLEFKNGDYKELQIPDGAVVYLDPPYINSHRVHVQSDIIFDEFWDYVRKLSTRCRVFTTTYAAPEDFTVVHDFGNTVNDHLYHGKVKNGGEKLIVYHDF